ncbi:Gfo/Idh/MocA family oxidoreductase [Fulvimarina sp. 2208YS6-2-32]|uniref:Gfo/Idh/MocA family oxidoreductase n=1 Tax=Fulvimarina uroteuthidis TaxID=3098149 RepID=A0ABU5HXE6_9HYPH|nr:Gfo/Idh/MocA family oxidoreductase [Fulvimarina sp. 2208YS6-2-32]MDY8107806.1 Gfo/Idh/MocA family oxidoreductase [Fulvimarina sp. 2208YS6-2-32]
MPSLEGKIRYGVVGAGWISQCAFMPGVAQTTNSMLTALVSGTPEKNERLGIDYGLNTYTYEQYDELLASGTIDAVYIGLPNDQHRRFAVPALEAGIHVLLEKPMATSLEDAEAIEAAARASGAKLMIAYRLHCEPGTISMVEAIRKGEIGKPRFFTSTFSQEVAAWNYRAKSGFWGGPVADMGNYPINAVRNLFEAEPIEVSAVGSRTERDLDCDDTVSVILKFTEGRQASFTVCYSSESTEMFHVVGDAGAIKAGPCFGFSPSLAITYELTRGDETETVEAPVTDQFAGETDYFSHCILNDLDPEPNGEEGVLDMRVIAAIEKAIETGQTQTLEPRSRTRRMDVSLKRELSYGKQPEMVAGKPPVG